MSNPTNNLNDTVSLISDISALARKWRALEENADRSFFLSWEWVTTTLNVTTDPAYCAEVTDDTGNVIALGIFFAINERRRGVLKVRQLRLHETLSGQTKSIPAEYNELLCLSGMENAAWNAILKMLTSQNTIQWDEIVITNGTLAIEQIDIPKPLFCYRHAQSISGAVDLAALREKNTRTVDDLSLIHI